MRDGIYHFAGFDDWIEIFRSGSYTDMSGESVSISDDDLDKIVQNFSEEDRAPAVIGHPKIDDPAVGWASKLKRQGSSLFAKFSDMYEPFVKGVERGSYRNRSVKIAPTKNGWKLQHVGWLGAALSAVAGMQPVNLAECDDEKAIEFSVPEGPAAHRRTGWGFRIFSSIGQRFREYIIEQESIEKANEIISAHDVDELRSIADDLLDVQPRPAPEPAPAFSSDDDPDSISTATGDADVTTKSGHKPDASAKPNGDQAKQFSQEDVDTLQQTAREEAETSIRAEAKREADAREFVSQQVDSGRLTPGMAEGLPELLSSLAGDESPELEFASGEKSRKVTRHDYLKGWISNLPENFAHLFSKQDDESGEQDVDTGDAEAIADKASDFVASEAAAGRTISVADAVRHVTEGK